jgi:SPP1 family predicted phage head-tail adaptor
MRAGELRHRISIEQNTPTRDTFGAEIPHWSVRCVVWAQVETISGTEFVSQQQFGAALSHKVTIRHRKGLVPTMRVMWGDRTLEILAVLEDNLRKMITLMCSEMPLYAGRFVVGTSAIGSTDEVS